MKALNSFQLSNIRGKRQTESGIEGKWHTGPWQDVKFQLLIILKFRNSEFNKYYSVARRDIK